MNSYPVPPHYDPEQMRAENTHDIVQRQQPATLGTWIVGILLVVVAVVWLTLFVTDSHRTSVMPESVRSPAAPRSVVPAR